MILKKICRVITIYLITLLIIFLLNYVFGRYIFIGLITEDVLVKTISIFVLGIIVLIIINIRPPISIFIYGAYTLFCIFIMLPIIWVFSNSIMYDFHESDLHMIAFVTVEKQEMVTFFIQESRFLYRRTNDKLRLSQNNTFRRRSLHHSNYNLTVKNHDTLIIQFNNGEEYQVSLR
ncbi:hypothetical protein [Paenibacillus gansuensis]|uniref:Uncharacterized protein n=1 Tax=Paenibacillus gansuensis TaxID=306542 RepID=A0ABW5PF69_9BACL